MRDRLFRAAALIIGLLGIPSLAWQIIQKWPLVAPDIEFYAMQAIVLLVFIAFGLGIAYRQSE